MKTFLIVAMAIAASGAYTPASAQLLKRLKNKVKETVDERAEEGTGNATNKAIDKGVDATKKKNPNNDGSKSGNSNSPDNNSSDGQAAPSVNSASSGPVTLKTYFNYDFVEGDQVIFESQLPGEKTGEIPSQFTLVQGQMDVQEEDGENVIHVPAGDGATFTPRMTSQSYLPDQFTVEFDIRNERFGLAHISIGFGDADDAIQEILFEDGGGLNWTTGDAGFPQALDVSDDHPMTWHHIAIAINKNVGKIYVDQYRVANVNNIKGKASSINFIVNGYETSFLKNIRIAAGGIDIYKKVTTDGKIITHGILFDVDKATIKPRSMGTMNEIYQLLKKDPSLKFEIDGHTDNTGTDQRNMELSQQRADAIKAELVKMGIDGSRLTTKGFGDTRPIGDNGTPEGRANNRRVEFVRK